MCAAVCARGYVRAVVGRGGGEGLFKVVEGRKGQHVTRVLP